MPAQKVLSQLQLRLETHIANVLLYYKECQRIDQGVRAAALDLAGPRADVSTIPDTLEVDALCLKSDMRRVGSLWCDLHRALPISREGWRDRLQMRIKDRHMYLMNSSREMYKQQIDFYNEVMQCLEHLQRDSSTKSWADVQFEWLNEYKFMSMSDIPLGDTTPCAKYHGLTYEVVLFPPVHVGRLGGATLCKLHNWPAPALECTDTLDLIKLRNEVVGPDRRIVGIRFQMHEPFTLVGCFDELRAEVEKRQGEQYVAVLALANTPMA